MVNPPSSEGWIHSDQLSKLPPQRLEAGEADAFLEYLFSALARRPARLSVREGIRVARYLRALDGEMDAGPRRQVLKQLEGAIGRLVLEYAPAERGDQRETITFLERHADTYLAPFDVAAALRCIRESAPPVKEVGVTRPPHLVSSHIAAHGDGTPQLRDDLSERIYAAYKALRRAGVGGARQRVADALNRKGLKISARGTRSTVWGPYEVYERVKQYENGLAGRFGNRRQARAWGEAMINKWGLLFQTSPAKAQAPAPD
jgi:hypothetical protein